MTAMNNKTAIIILATIVLIIGYWWYMLVWHSVLTTGDNIRVHFLNIGQGDAILIETPNNKQVLIDAGRGIRILNEIDSILPASDRDIDVAIITHPDEDHIGGFIPILQRYTVGTVLQSFIESESDTYKQVATAIKEEGAITHTIQTTIFIFPGWHAV